MITSNIIAIKLVENTIMMLLVFAICSVTTFRVTEGNQKSLTVVELKKHFKQAEKTIALVVDYYLELYNVFMAYKKSKDQDIELIKNLQDKEPKMSRALRDKNIYCEPRQMKLLNLTLNCVDEMWMFIIKKSGLHQPIFGS